MAITSSAWPGRSPGASGARGLKKRNKGVVAGESAEEKNPASLFLNEPLTVI